MKEYRLIWFTFYPGGVDINHILRISRERFDSWLMFSALTGNEMHPLVGPLMQNGEFFSEWGN